MSGRTAKRSAVPARLVWLDLRRVPHRAGGRDDVRWGWSDPRGTETGDRIMKAVGAGAPGASRMGIGVEI
jgi:hypothetical protein